MTTSPTARDIAIIWSSHATDHFAEGWIEPPKAPLQNALFNMWTGDKFVRYDCTIRFWEPPTTSSVVWWKPFFSQSITAGYDQERHWWEIQQDVTIYTSNCVLLPKYPICPIRITWKEREIALRGSLAIVPRGVRFKL
jgi:hypothetical protein